MRDRRQHQDLYWDIRPKPEFGTVEIRVCDTPLNVQLAASLAALAQCLARYLLRTRPAFNARLHLCMWRVTTSFQACRYGFDAQLSDPIRQQQVPLRQALGELLETLDEDAQALGCSRWIENSDVLASGATDAQWLRALHAKHKGLNDVVPMQQLRLSTEVGMELTGNPK